jgi:hypothetical protein
MLKKQFSPSKSLQGMFTDSSPMYPSTNLKRGGGASEEEGPPTPEPLAPPDLVPLA